MDGITNEPTFSNIEDDEKEGFRRGGEPRRTSKAFSFSLITKDITLILFWCPAQFSVWLFLDGRKLEPLFLLMFEWTKMTVKAQWVKAKKKKKLNKKRKPISMKGEKNTLKNLKVSVMSSSSFNSSLTYMQRDIPLVGSIYLFS